MSNKNICWIFHKGQWKSGYSVADNLYLDSGEFLDVVEHRTYPKNSDDDINNLIDLIHLNEPSILYSSLVRYGLDKIYTFTGKILLAINPFKILPIYNNTSIKDYCNGNTTPHPYLISQQCLTNLIESCRSQVVLVSGESGAGKTVTTKFLMKYISNVATKGVNTLYNLEDKILASNPIMEAFGNAKTLRNDNSSRFGKFIKLQFSQGTLVGTKIETYLLEKIRLTSLGEGERNFHIFYILLKCCDRFKTTDLKKFKYLAKSSVITRDDNVTDEDMYTELLDSFKKLMFTDEEIDSIFDIVYFILLLGNGDINALREFNLGFNIDLLEDYLKRKVIHAHGEEIVTERSPDEIENSFDTIAQNMYLLLFNFIVSKINRTIESEEDSYIGILDIFGFEVFKNNGFEQLCINYTNERLQGIFNKYIFELEQEEYKKEGIEWEDIEFQSNKNIISTIDAKTDSIFSYQIEQSILGSGNDMAFYHALYKNLLGDVVTVSNSERSRKKFAVDHYAGKVVYGSKGYIEKNRNTMDSRFNVFVKSSNNHVVIGFDTSIFNFVTKKIKNKNIITQFKQQLDKLLGEISRHNQFYIRCIKPNDNNICNNFDKKRVLEQFRYCGVLEAIKIARLGYPVRMKNNVFKDVFYSLLRGREIQDLLMKYDTGFRIGFTKVFLKKDLHSRLCLDNDRVRDECAMVIQKSFRMMWVKKRVELVKRFLLLSQRRIKREFVVKTVASTKMTAFWRGIVQMMIYKDVRSKIIKIQAIKRRIKCKTEFNRLLSAVKIERFYRIFKFKERYTKVSGLWRIFELNAMKSGFIKLLKNGRENESILKIQHFYRVRKKLRELNDRAGLLMENERLKEENRVFEERIEQLIKENENYVYVQTQQAEQAQQVPEIFYNDSSTQYDMCTMKTDASVQCNSLRSEDLSNIEFFYKKAIKDYKFRNDILNSDNNKLGQELSNKNKIILNLTNKVSEMLDYKSETDTKIENFEKDQEILGDKLKGLYLRIDRYIDILRLHRLDKYI